MARVAVLGAGLSGLITSRRLAVKPELYKFVTYECAEKAGGTWVYTNKVRSEFGKYEHLSPCVWDELETNSPEPHSIIPGFGYKNRTSGFKHHSKIFEYMQQFIEHFQLDKSIKYNHAVEKVAPIKDQSGKVKAWKVDVRDIKSDTVSTEEFDYVLDCCGRFGNPKDPKIPGLETFDGIAINSDDFRSGSRFKGMRVVVVGISWSSFDILTNQLSSYPKEVCWSYEPKGLYATIPNLDASMKREGLNRKPAISSVNGKTVTFTNGDTYDADAIIHCTGFELKDRSFYTPECGLTIKDGRIDPLYKFIFNVNNPSHMFFGITYNFMNFEGCDYLVRCALNIMEGKAKLPSHEEMLEDIKKNYEEQLERYGDAKRTMTLVGPENPGFYQEICELGNLEPFPEVQHEVLSTHVGYILENWETFRKYEYNIVDNKLTTTFLG